jgi:cellulose synthase/poly-beta-1,6-N-acetylglucosamine synthase-like glycosyltransferase
MARQGLRRRDALPFGQVTVDIVIPVYNEEVALPKGVATLRDYLDTYFPYEWRVIVANNASTDNTLAVARSLPPPIRASPSCISTGKGAGGR